MFFGEKYSQLILFCSGASGHMTFDKNDFVSYTEWNHKRDSVEFGDAVFPPVPADAPRSKLDECSFKGIWLGLAGVTLKKCRRLHWTSFISSSILPCDSSADGEEWSLSCQQPLRDRAAQSEFDRIHVSPYNTVYVLHCSVYSNNFARSI
jgi:hypothetical protein